MNLSHLLENNRKWAEGQDPSALAKQAAGQAPKYLWIGCSDSRVPPNEILGLAPGEIFVHRNIANLCPVGDLSSLSALQYAVEHLKVEHVIVCGHYGCGGIAASLDNDELGLIDNWLRNIRDVYDREKEQLSNLYGDEKTNRLAELSAIHQVMNICDTETVQSAWANDQKLTIHAWIYDLSTGLLKDLDCSIASTEQLRAQLAKLLS